MTPASGVGLRSPGFQGSMTNLRLRDGTAVKKSPLVFFKGLHEAHRKILPPGNCPSHAARILPFYDLIAGKAFIGDGGLMLLQLLFADPGNPLQRLDIGVSEQGILNERIAIFSGYFIGREI